jgi:hypothetical protein
MCRLDLKAKYAASWWQDNDDVRQTFLTESDGSTAHHYSATVLPPMQKLCFLQPVQYLTLDDLFRNRTI